MSRAQPFTGCGLAALVPVEPVLGDDVGEPLRVLVALLADLGRVRGEHLRDGEDQGVVVLRSLGCGADRFDVSDLRDLRIRQDRLDNRPQAGDLRSERVVGGMGRVDVDDGQTVDLLCGDDLALVVIDGAGTCPVTVGLRW